MSAVAAMWLPLLFGFALFLSSAMLFVVQPMIGRTLLPHLGGNPLAWNVCLVFFQANLLAGYVYADRLHRFRGLRWQPWLQLFLLATATILCFAGIFGDRLLNNLAPRLTSFETSPIFTTICLLIVVIGLPFLTLAAVIPLVQRWFAHLDHPRASDPYFLVVASNLGALVALTIYPLLIEPYAPLAAQWMSWKLAVTALGVLLFLVALCAWLSPRNVELEPAPPPTDPNAPLVPRLIGRGPATWPRRLYWFAASALPVGLLMGLTDYLTLDVAPAAILWAVPLALYLIAFSQEFARFAPFALGGRGLNLFMQVVLTLFLAFAVGMVFLIMNDNKPARPGIDTDVAVACGFLFALLLLIPSSWLAILQPISVLAVVFLQANVVPANGLSPALLTLQVTCFYLSTRLCFGRLAEDRPAAPALTTYYCWIGLGGLCGGVFQLLIAPMLFRHGYLEFAFLAALASTLRPAWCINGLTDWILCRMILLKPDPTRRRVAIGFDFTLAVVVAIVAGIAFTFRAQTRLNIPLFACVFLAVLLFVRPMRFGFALAAVILLSFIGTDVGQDNKLLVRQRTSFGMLRVTERTQPIKEHTDNRPLRLPKLDPQPREFTERSLIQGTKHRGSSITDPAVLQRYPTSYYQRGGPVGQIMRSLDGFSPVFPKKIDENDHWEIWLRLDRDKKVDHWLRKNPDNAKFDTRIVASLIGMGATQFAPLQQLGAAWSEPPYAFIGLGTGTLFAYAHPYQWVDAYELDPAIIALSTGTPPMFNHFQAAGKRGVSGRIIAGDGHRSLSKPGREGFYHVLFLDAFNSDAMPIHSLTQEAIELYFQKLAPDGLLCIHITSRTSDLFPVLNRIAEQLGLGIRRLHVDPADDRLDLSFAASTWVVLARNDEILHHRFDRVDRAPLPQRLRQPIFDFRDSRKLLWTDEHANPLSAVRPGSGWPGLIYAMLIILLLFGLLLGAIEVGVVLTARSVVKKPPPK